MPELCGSTSDSIAWTAIAASTALPPRLRTLSPAWAASGLAAITYEVLCSRASMRMIGGAAGTVAPDPKPTKAIARTSLRTTDMPIA